MKRIIIITAIILVSIISLVSCNPTGKKSREIIELSDRDSDDLLAQIEDVEYHNGDIYLAGYHLDESGNRKPTFWINSKDRKIELPMPPDAVQSVIINIGIQDDGTVHALVTSGPFYGKPYHYYNGTTSTYTTSMSDGTTDYNAVNCVEVIDNDVYVVAKYVNPTTLINEAMGVFKNGTKSGNIVLDPNTTEVWRPRDIYVDELGKVYIASAYHTGSWENRTVYAGWWINDGSDFVNKGDPNGLTWQNVRGMVSPDDYVIEMNTGSGYLYKAFVNGEEVELEMPDDIYELFTITPIVKTDGETYIGGDIRYDEDGDGAYVYYPVVWTGDGSIDTFVDFATIGTDYDTLIQDPSSLAVESKDNYVFPLSELRKTDKYKVTGYLRKTNE